MVGGLFPCLARGEMPDELLPNLRVVAPGGKILAVGLAERGCVTEVLAARDDAEALAVLRDAMGALQGTRVPITAARPMKTASAAG